MGGGEPPERIAGTDGDAIGGLHAGMEFGIGDDQHSARLEKIGIDDRRIAGEEFAPTRTSAETAASQLPERVAKLNKESFCFAVALGRERSNRHGARHKGRWNGIRRGGQQQVWRGRWRDVRAWQSRRNDFGVSCDRRWHRT